MLPEINYSRTSLTLSEQKSDSFVGQDSLLHGESLFVVSSSDLEDVSLELVSEVFSLNFLSHSLIVKDSDSFIVVNFDRFLLSSGWISNVELWRD